MQSNLLPIGSIVQIKGGTTPIMIIGYGPTVKETNAILHYLGTNYPYGISSALHMIAFNIEDIEAVVHKGYEDNMTSEWCEKISNYLFTTN